MLNHIGQPAGIGRYAGHAAEDLRNWASTLQQVADRPNTSVKIGGLGTHLAGFLSFHSPEPFSSQALAQEGRPGVEMAIEGFGPARCLFESNLPTGASGSFSTVCNAYQRITQPMTLEERSMVFAGTAARVYRLDVDLTPSPPSLLGPGGSAA